MASVASIAKGQALALALQKVYGITPKIQYLQNKTRIYYSPDDIPKLKAAMSAKGESDLDFDWFPIFQGDIIKKALPFGVAILAAGYIIGKL